MITVGLVFGLILCVWQLSRSRARYRRAEAELRYSQQELRRFAENLVSVREEERKSIAREIHDELGSALTGLAMDLSRTAKLASTLPERPQKELSEKFDRMTSTVKDVAKTMRSIVTELRPRVLDDFGLIAAIEWQAEQFENRSEVTCHLSLPSEPLNLDQDKRTALFRILQEALTNIARYANATRVEISLQKSHGHLVFEVRDNGQGITEKELVNANSLGLLNMRERALLLGGTTTVLGLKGKGTTVRVIVPLEEETGVDSLPQEERFLENGKENVANLTRESEWNKVIRILVVDDHSVVRYGIIQIVSDEPDIEVTAQAATGQEALDFLEREEFDILILDIALPVRGGLDVLRDVRRLYPELPVLVLSMYPEKQYGVRAIKAGASGYMNKESMPEELVVAIRKVAAGEKYGSERLLGALMKNVNSEVSDPPHDTLSNREFQVLKMIGRGKTVEEIGKELSLSVKTVSTFRTRVLGKMNIRNNADIMRYVIENELGD